jgi:hypothetical protein
MTDETEQQGHLARTPGQSGHDDTKWMAVFSALDDHEVDALLAGSTPADADLAPVAEVAQALRRRAAAEPVPPMSDSLRAQLNAPGVVSLAAHRATRGALIKAGAAAAAVIAVAALGVGASQNRLPAGLQDVVSSTADLVGIDLPHAADRGQGDDHRSEQGDDNAKDDTAPDNGQGDGNDGDPGYDGTTPGGATPADPGTPGDKEPATPATPPDKEDVSGSKGTQPDKPAPSSTQPPTTEQAEDTDDTEGTDQTPVAGPRGNGATKGNAG